MNQWRHKINVENWSELDQVENNPQEKDNSTRVTSHDIVLNEWTESRDRSDKWTLANEGIRVRNNAKRFPNFSVRTSMSTENGHVENIFKF